MWFAGGEETIAAADLAARLDEADPLQIAVAGMYHLLLQKP